MKDYILRKIAKYLIYLSFLTTLLVLPTLFIFPYVVPKVIFFRSVILLVSGVTLVLYLYSLKLKNNSKNKLFTPISVSLALFLAIGKRRSERTLLLGTEAAASHTRKILLHYPETLLDSLTVMFATTTWLAYTMFTFLQPPPSAGPQVLVLFGDYLPRTLLASKWLMITVPFVIYGVMRYLYVIYEKKEGESPERVLLSDIPLLTSIVIWTLLVFLIIYASDILPARFIRLLQ